MGRDQLDGKKRKKKDKEQKMMNGATRKNDIYGRMAIEVPQPRCVLLTKAI